VALTAEQHPPGPVPRQMLTDTVAIFRDPLRYLMRMREQFGPVVAFPTPPSPAWFVDDPAAVDRVLRTNAGNYTKQTVQYGALSLLTGDGLLTTDNPQWLTRRRQVNPAFHRRTLDRLVGCVTAAADGLDRELSALTSATGTGRVDVDGPLMRATLDVVSRGLFSAELGSPDTGTRHSRGARAKAGPDIAGAVLVGLEEVMRRATRPLHAPRSWPTPGNRRLARSLATLDAAIGDVIALRSDGQPGPDPDGPDVLDLLLAHLGDLRAVRDEAVTLVVAGHETVASTMEWAALLLAQHPDWQDAVAAEATAVLGRHGAVLGRDGAGCCDAAAVGLADLARLRITRAVLDETLRLYPPAWVITRRATGTDELAGHLLPAGTLVILSPWVRHRDPVAWAHPDRFDPARFLDRGERGRPDLAYLPFGSGPRLCIGRDFALVEATVLLARLILRWRLAPVARHPVRPHPRVTVRPRGGLPLQVTPRSP